MSIMHCYGNTQTNAHPRPQQKPTVFYMVQTTGLQNHQMGVFLVGYKFKQFGGSQSGAAEDSTLWHVKSLFSHKL